MDTLQGTSFSKIYESFFSKITDDMYMELTPQETSQEAEKLLLTAVHKFEFPRVSLAYELDMYTETSTDIKTGETVEISVGGFLSALSVEEINILATYMIVEWLGQQLASIENVRMKYSGSDFKFTSQANHIQKVLQLKKDYEREGFHLQRLYERRIKDENGIYKSTFGSIMTPLNPTGTGE